MFELARDSSVPLVDQIVGRLSGLIQDGKLVNAVAPGKAIRAPLQH